MKKILPSLIVGILISSGLCGMPVSCKKVDSEKTSIYFSNLQINETNEGILLKLKGANSVLLKKNFYIVPTRIETFMFPFGTEIKSVKCTPKNIHEQQLTKKLIISPEPALSSETSSMVHTEKPENPRSGNTWYNYRIGCGINGNQRNIIVKVEVFPVQYFPSKNVVYWTDNIEIEIQYNEPEHTMRLFDEQYDLVVLTEASYFDELSSLVAHKIARGVSTKLVNLDDVYNGSYFAVEGRDNPEKIKYFIKNTIENWDTKYVLLVGDSNNFPTRETHVYIAEKNDDELFVSDLYYADIYTGAGGFSSWDTNKNDVFGEYGWGPFHQLTDEVDLYPDVYLSRLACTTKEEVTVCVNKIINYETSEAITKDWFTHLVVIGGDTVPHDTENVDEGEYLNQAAIDIMDGFIPTKCWASEGTLNTVDPVNNAINNGAGFVYFEGHGEGLAWYTHPHNQNIIWIPKNGGYQHSDVLSLSNRDRLPIVVISACYVACFDAWNNCFSWSFLVNPNGGGIGSIGFTGRSYSYPGTYAIQELSGKIASDTFEAYKMYQVKTFGEMWAKTISNYIFTVMDGYDYKTLESWQSFGDPSLAIQNESTPPNFPPIIPEAPEGPASGNAGNSYTYLASTTDPEGDQISYLFDWGDGTYSEWTNLKNSGETASANHTWDSTGSFQIRVRAKDSHGVLSRWSDPLPITMPYSYDTSTLAFLELLFQWSPQCVPTTTTTYGILRISSFFLLII